MDSRSLACAYLHAKRAVLDAGYGWEIAWQENACSAPFTESRFLSEAAWVVLSSGMRESVVHRVFSPVAAAFGGFETADRAVAAVASGARSEALGVFRHPGKIGAIVEIVEHLHELGLARVRWLLETQGTTYLQTLPYLGPVTALHLAKNLGQDVAKPDRHMVRIARACGYEDAQRLCWDLREFLGEPIPVVDIVFWRFATLSHGYLAQLLRVAGLSSRQDRVLAPRRRSEKHPI